MSKFHELTIIIFVRADCVFFCRKCNRFPLERACAGSKSSYMHVFLCTKFTFSMSSDDDFDDVAYKEFEDQLYEEQSLSGLVMFLTLGNHVFFSPINFVQSCQMSV